jgi:hypothetical protein
MAVSRKYNNIRTIRFSTQRYTTAAVKTRNFFVICGGTYDESGLVLPPVFVGGSLDGEDSGVACGLVFTGLLHGVSG